MSQKKRRILIFAERLRPPLDEGFKNTTIQLVRAFRQSHEVLALTTFGADIATEGVHNIPANKLLLSAPLRQAMRQFAPDVVLYIPTASATPAAMLRARVLASYASPAHIALLALQPRTQPLARLLVRFLAPCLILAQSMSMVTQLTGSGCRVAHMGNGVDAGRFAPLPPAERADVRRRLGLPPDRFIVLHVGHINANRNIQALARMQRPDCQVVIVGSTSTTQDDSLAHELEQAGVIIVREYVTRIEEYYQAADCYVFPVISETGAIAMPLSILEAMACNLPVVTMPYGDVPAIFPSGQGLSVVRNDWEMIGQVMAARHATHVDTRRMALPFSWPALANDLLQTVTGQS